MAAASNDEQTTTVKLEFEPEYSVLPARETARLTFGAHLTAPVMEDDNKRSIVSLSAVLDRSGSMSGNKIALVKKSQDFMMQQLSAKDKLGVVQYDSDVQELLKLARTSETYKREAKLMIDRIQAGSCTNLSGGLFAGIAQQQGNRYVDYESTGPGGPSSAGGAGSPNSQQASENPPSPPASVAASDFTDVGSEVSNFSEYVDVPSAVQNVDLPLAPVQADEQDDQFDAQQQMQIPIQQMQMPVQMQQQQAFVPPLPRARRGIVQRMTDMFRPSRSSASKSSGKEVGFASLLQGGKALKGLELELEADALRSVFLFTDGLANEGIQDANRLVDMLQRMLDKTPRVRVYTFGYGADHSPDLLQRIAAAGSGTYYFIENEESIPTAFADALGGLLSVAAQNVSVEFQPAPGVNVSEVHTSFTTTNGSNGSRTISVGDLFSQEAKDILFDVELPALSASVADYTVGTLRISYLDVAGACMRSDEVRCVVARPDVVPEGLVASSNVAIQKARIMTAKTLAEAKKEADAGRYEEARARVQTSLKYLSSVSDKTKGNKKHEAMSSNLCEDLEEALTNMQDQKTYASKGAQIMSCKSAAHGAQRSAAQEREADWAEEGQQGEQAFSYASVQQIQMRRKAKAFFSK